MSLHPAEMSNGGLADELMISVPRPDCDPGGSVAPGAVTEQDRQR